jgi:hypothetical protein
MGGTQQTPFCFDVLGFDLKKGHLKPTSPKTLKYAVDALPITTKNSE